MARLPRVNPIGVAQHVIQRGNNRQVCFVREQDFGAYIGWLKEYSKKFQVDIHAWNTIGTRMLIKDEGAQRAFLPS